METAREQLSEQITPLALQRLWARRLNGSIIHEETDIAELLQDSGVFPSAQVEVSMRFFFIYYINYALLYGKLDATNEKNSR